MAKISVEIVLVLETETFFSCLTLEQGAKVKDALAISGFAEKYATYFSSLDVGVFGTKVSLEQSLQEGDRVEIYRNLKCDPKQNRRLRISKNS